MHTLITRMMSEPIVVMATPKTPETFAGQVNHIILARTQVIQRLALESRKQQGVPDASKEPTSKLLPRLDQFLEWLDTMVKMSPELKVKSRVDEGLLIMFRNPKYHFVELHRRKAQELHERWEAERWGAPPTTIVSTDVAQPSNEGNSPDDDMPSEPPSKRRKSMSDARVELGYKPVPKDHRVWGANGIMHGMARKRGKRKVNIMNPDCEAQQRDARKHGDNGVPIGSWFPYQLVALFNGVHGSSQAGIHYGEGNDGAYSIVVSGLYDELDNDRGERIWYSGSGSHDNEDPSQAATKTRGTKALHKSLQTGSPVRVLRSASGKSRYAPSCGIRYDGLYTVAGFQRKHNANGGLYEQFELRRMPGQLSLEECLKHPNAKERRDFDMIERGY